MSNWFYVDASQTRQGPVGAEALVEAFRQGRVGNDSLVWREGLAQWSPLQDFRDELGLAGITPIAPASAAAIIAPTADAPAAKKNNGCLIAAALVVGGGLFLVFVLAVVAAISLPAYQDYITRSKLTGARVEGQAAKIAVAEFKANTDRCPRDAGELGLSAPVAEGLDQLEVGSLDDGRCAVELTFGTFGTNASVAGNRLLMTLEEDGRWSCSSADIPARYLPSDCK